MELATNNDDIVVRLRCESRVRNGNDRVEAADEIERLRKIETTARALKFSGYPAHGTGYVIQVTGGNINDLKDALAGKLDC